MHFAEGHWTSSDIPPERFIGPAVGRIDVSDKTAVNPDYMLTPAISRASRKPRMAESPMRAIAAAADGVERALARQENLSGRRHARRRVPPAFSFLWAGAAALLVNERHAHMIGVDTASVDYGPSQNFLVHRIVPRRTPAAWKI